MELGLATKEKEYESAIRFAYEICVMAAGAWLVVSGASWLALSLFLAINFSALAIFSNRFWKHRWFLGRPLDSPIALVGNALILIFPALLFIGPTARVRCLVALVLLVFVRLLMVAPSETSWRKPRRGGSSDD